MNKKVLAVALAALPFAAMADVTIYGTMAGGFEHDTAAHEGPSQNKVDDYTSLIGFKGSEDLGNGLKTIWQVENRIHLDGTGSSDTMATRQTWVGLDGGNLGKIRMGHLNFVENDQYSIDQWSDGSGVNGLQLFDSGTRMKNAIRYDSASFAGVSFAFGYSAGENKGSGSDSSDVWTYGINYDTPLAGLSLHYAGNYDENPGAVDPGISGTTFASSTSRKANTNLIEADYTQDNLFLAAAYKWSTGYDLGNGYAMGDYAGINGIKIHQAAFSAAYTFGAIKPKFSVAKAWNAQVAGSDINDSGYTQFVVGVDYLLSKRTTVGVTYGHMNQGNNMQSNTSTNMTGTDLGYDVPKSTTSMQISTSF
jgi:predicted porin